MAQQLAIIDYGMGNHFSVQKTLTRLGYNSVTTNNPEIIIAADKLLLPGVGHFGKAMNNLKELGLIDVLNHYAVKGNPILGICLGMQLMCTYSEEGDSEGLGWFNATAKKIMVDDAVKYKIPHTGWNQINMVRPSKLFNSLSDTSEFYFVHSYHVVCQEQKDILLNTTYETSFVSGIQKDNLFGVQFHPEKSHEAGRTLINNFLEL